MVLIVVNVVRLSSCQVVKLSRCVTLRHKGSIGFGFSGFKCYSSSNCWLYCRLSRHPEPQAAKVKNLSLPRHSAAAEKGVIKFVRFAQFLLTPLQLDNSFSGQLDNSFSRQLDNIFTNLKTASADNLLDQTPDHLTRISCCNDIIWDVFGDYRSCADDGP